jgi:hypothetical protein
MVNLVGAVSYSVVRTSDYFFILLYDAIRISDHIAPNGGMIVYNELKELGRMWSWINTSEFTRREREITGKPVRIADLPVESTTVLLSNTSL